ncbi:DNA mismatch repair protein [Escherichia coli]|uniref:DNA mismatch repair protein n=1 Tax=Escherichia coli TaxID=562 RepID=A0A377CWN7_ECOLX|nr:DNA mismatch repair protein [Escherichia coli]
MLWSPNEEEDRQLREDWEELMDMIVLGQVGADYRSSRGVFTDTTESSECESAYRSHWCRGERILTLPRGFYLKKNFTSALLARHFLIQ